MSPPKFSTLETSALQAEASSSPQHVVAPALHRSRRLRVGLGQSSEMVRRFSLVAISAIALSLGSCARDPSATSLESPQESTTAVTADELQMVTTFLPITQFTKAVAGDRAKVTQLLPTNIGPHDYQAKPEDAQRLAQADVLVQNGLEMEEFLDDLVKNAGNPKLKIVDSSQGVSTIAAEASEDNAPDHDHAHAANAQEKTKHGNGQGHEHGNLNPHIWLDPKRAIQQVENIRDGLIAADPDGKEIYTANAAAYIEKLRDLDAETAALLQSYVGKTFVAFHDFAPYFAQSYNLKVNFLVDAPEGNPSPGDVKRVMDTVKATNLKTLLTEPQGGQDAFAALAQDLNVRVSTFDPMEMGGPDSLQPDYYLSTMRQNVKTLVSAFTGSSPQSSLPIWQPMPGTVVSPSVGIRV